jgi:hypothetical protein
MYTQWCHRIVQPLQDKDGLLPTPSNSFTQSSKWAKLVTLLTSIRKVPGSDLGRGVDYLTELSRGSPQWSSKI